MTLLTREYEPQINTTANELQPLWYDEMAAFNLLLETAQNENWQQSCKQIGRGALNMSHFDKQYNAALPDEVEYPWYRVQVLGSPSGSAGSTWRKFVTMDLQPIFEPTLNTATDKFVHVLDAQSLTILPTLNHLCLDQGIYGRTLTQYYPPEGLELNATGVVDISSQQR